eukprot:tig00020610_g11994.t1
MLLAERSSTLLQQLLSRHIVVVRAKHAQFSAQPPAQRGTSPYAPERGPAPRPLWLRSKPRTEFNSWSPATTNVQRAAASRRRKRASDLAAVPVATQALHGGRGREPLAYAGLLLLLLRRLNALFRGEIFRAEHAGCIILCGEKALQFLLGQAPVRWTGLIMNICIKGTTTSGRAEAWKAFRARRDWVSVPKDDRLQIPGGQAPDYSFVLELLTITEKDAVVRVLCLSFPHARSADSHRTRAEVRVEGPRATSDLAGRLEWSAQEAVRRCLAEDGAASEDVQRILLNSLTLEKNVEQLTSKDPPPRQRGIISVLACVCLAERLPSAAFPRCANAGIGSGVGTSAWDAAWDAISADLGRVAPPAIPAPADLGVPSPTQARCMAAVGANRLRTRVYYFFSFEGLTLSFGARSSFLLGQAPVRWTGLIMNICIKGTTTSGRAEAWKAFRARRDWVSAPKDDRLQIPGGQAPDYSFVLEPRQNSLSGEIFRAEHAGCIILCGEKALQFLLGQAPVRWTGLIMNICIKGTTTSGRAEAWKAFRARRDWVSVPKDDRLQIPGGQAPDYSFVLELLTITEKDAVKCGLKGPRATSDLAGRLEWSAQEAVRRCLAEDGAASEDVQRILLNSLTLEKNVEQLTSKDPPPRQRGIISVLACVCLAERLPSAAFPRCANAGIGSGVGTSAWDAAWDAISADLGRVAPPAIPAPADLGVPSPTQAYAPAPRSPS